MDRGLDRGMDVVVDGVMYGGLLALDREWIGWWIWEVDRRAVLGWIGVWILMWIGVCDWLRGLDRRGRSCE